MSTDCVTPLYPSKEYNCENYDNEDTALSDSRDEQYEQIIRMLKLYTGPAADQISLCLSNLNEARKIKDQTSGIPEITLNNFDEELRAFSDVILYIYPHPDSTEAIACIHASKLLLARNSKYFHKAFSTGMTETSTPYMKYYLLENETLASATMLIDIMSSAVPSLTIEQEINTIVEDKLWLGLVDKLQMMLETDLRELLLRHVMQSADMIALIQLSVLDLAGLPKLMDLYYEKLKGYSTTVLLDHLWKAKETVKFPKKVVSMMSCDYLNEHQQTYRPEKYVDSAADIWILAGMGGYSDIASTMERWLPVSFASYLLLAQFDGYWWESAWGTLVNPDALDKTMLQSRLFVDFEDTEQLYGTNKIDQLNTATPLGRSKYIVKNIPLSKASGTRVTFYAAGLLWTFIHKKDMMCVKPENSRHILRVAGTVTYKHEGTRRDQTHRICLVHEPHRSVTYQLYNIPKERTDKYPNMQLRLNFKY